MALCTVKISNELDNGIILAPERYHPGRNLRFNEKVTTTKLEEIVNVFGDTFAKKDLKKSSNNIYLINTGDASEGKLIGTKAFTENINSSKKVIKPGDVIISRLRPYLRQVAFVDDIFKRPDIIYLSSTEFYVLRSVDASKSIAFLIPFLLSEPVQNVFANAVEGSQHPRFNEDVLMNLEIPENIIANRKEISDQVMSAIADYRNYEKKILDYTQLISEEF